MQNLTKKTVGEPGVFVRAEDIAKRYKVTPRAVLLWADRGLIPALRIGSKTRRFNLADVISAIENKGGARQ